LKAAVAAATAVARFLIKRAVFPLETFKLSTSIKEQIFYHFCATLRRKNEF
jgi:hypothetical protein